MRFSAYVLFMLAISLPLYYLGYSNVMNEFTTPKAMNANGTSNISFVNQSIPITCPTGDPYCQQQQQNQTQPSLYLPFLTLLLGGAAVLVILLSGFSAMYVVPALILVAILNFVILPYGFVMDQSIPTIISYPLAFILNTVTILAVVDFIRGGA
jgi:hypothetical protein